VDEAGYGMKAPSAYPEESQFDRLGRIEDALHGSITSLETRLVAILTPLSDVASQVEAIPKEKSPLNSLVDRIEHANARLLNLLERIEL
jgi:hypothetical protein